MTRALLSSTAFAAAMSRIMNHVLPYKEAAKVLELFEDVKTKLRVENDNETITFIGEKLPLIILEKMSLTACELGALKDLVDASFQPEPSKPSNP